MKILFIDTETTGLDPTQDQILELGFLFDDHSLPLDQAKQFHALIRPRIVMSTSPLALWMNSDLLKQLEEIQPNAMAIANDFKTWFIKLMGTHDDTQKIMWGGKNIWKHDLPFLANFLGLQTHDMSAPWGVPMHHRSFDPSPLFAMADDSTLPSLNECAFRAGLSKPEHKALADCWTSAHLVRRGLQLGRDRVQRAS